MLLWCLGCKPNSNIQPETLFHEMLIIAFNPKKTPVIRFAFECLLLLLLRVSVHSRSETTTQLLIFGSRLSFFSEMSLAIPKTSSIVAVVIVIIKVILQIFWN